MQMMPAKNPLNVDVATRTLVERLCGLVSIRSVSREEEAIAEFTSGELASSGFEVRRDGNNVWTELGDAERPRLLLNTHVDTVPAAEGWTGDPWAVRVVDERVVGLGANDAKGCVAAMMETVILWKRRLEAGERLGGQLVLALTAEEEISGNGLATILDKIGPIDAAIVGEPTNLTPMIAQRGLLILKCTARGRAQHPANTPSDTVENAIANAAADVVRLRGFDWGAGHALLGRTHAHVTMISGGVARNVIPDRCEFWVDVRTTPDVSHAGLVERIRGVLTSEVQVHSERLVPVETSARERIVQAVTRALPGAKPAGSPAMSDMVFLAGVPAVKIGPGMSARSHTPDEYILVEELESGARAYERIVGAYFRMDVESGDKFVS